MGGGGGGGEASNARVVWGAVGSEGTARRGVQKGRWLCWGRCGCVKGVGGR